MVCKPNKYMNEIETKQQPIKGLYVFILQEYDGHMQSYIVYTKDSVISQD